MVSTSLKILVCVFVFCVGYKFLFSLLPIGNGIMYFQVVVAMNTMLPIKRKTLNVGVNYSSALARILHISLFCCLPRRTFLLNLLRSSKYSEIYCLKHSRLVVKRKVNLLNQSNPLLKVGQLQPQIRSWQI